MNKPRARKPLKRAKLTPKMLGLVDDVQLSESYANTRRHFKTISSNILGYYIAGGGRAPIRIAPIYYADVWDRPRKGVNNITSSFEIGEYFNVDEHDHDGNTLAYAASTLISRLERRAPQPPVRRRKASKK